MKTAKSPLRALGAVAGLALVASGTFAPLPVSFNTASVYFAGAPGSIAAADFNGDGKQDLAVSIPSGNAEFPGQIAILRGNGNGSFRLPSTFVVQNNSNPVYMAVGDFNGDGKPDLAVANYGAPGFPGNNVSILLGNGNGTFQTAVSYLVGTLPDSVVTADFNGDGHLDLAVANYNSNNLSILLGNGNGTFQPAVAYSG